MKVPRDPFPFFSHSAAFNGYLMDIGVLLIAQMEAQWSSPHFCLVTLRPFHFLVNLGLSRQVKTKA